MDTNIAVAVVACCFAGAAIQRFSGFGLNVTLMAVLPFVMPTYTSAVVLTGFISLFLSVALAARHWRNVRWRLVLLPLFTYFIFSTIATSMLGTADAVLRRVLGAVLILLAVFFLFRGDQLKINPTKANAFVAGTLSGLGNGLFSIGGPPMAIFLVGSTEGDNLAYLATLQCFFVCTGLYANALRAARGLFFPELIPLGIIGYLACIAGNLIGARVFRRFDSASLKRAVSIVMALSGLSSLVFG